MTYPGFFKDGDFSRPRIKPFRRPPEWDGPQLKDSVGLQIHPSQHTGYIILRQQSRAWIQEAIDWVAGQLVFVETNYQVSIVLDIGVESDAHHLKWYPAYIREPVYD